MYIMENELQVKVLDGKVHVDYTSLFDAGESFYEEFNLNEYKEKLNECNANHNSEISNNHGKLKFFYRGKDMFVTLSKNGTDTLMSGKSLSDKFFI
jgi:hypothetical protein